MIHNETGIIISPAQPESLANAMLNCLLNDERREDHGEAGRSRVLSTFSNQAMLKNYVDVYSRDCFA